MTNEEKGQPKVSLIIPTYNNSGFLRKILVSLMRQSFKDFELIIADDGSGSEIKELLTHFTDAFDYPIQYIWHPDKGFRKTIIINSAVKISRANYLVFVDADCVLHHKFIERHYLRKQKGVVLSGRRVILDEKLTERLSLEDIRSGKLENINYGWLKSQKNNWKRGIYLPFLFTIENFLSKDYWVFGSNFSLYKEDFYSVNGYEENIQTRGLEDINLSQRLKLKGYRIKKLTREALQYHLYHNFNPVPPNENFIHPKDYFADKGIN